MGFYNDLPGLGGSHVFDAEALGLLDVTVKEVDENADGKFLELTDSSQPLTQTISARLWKQGNFSDEYRLKISSREIAKLSDKNQDILYPYEQTPWGRRHDK